jgi:Pin2-interacting protein X1
MGLAGVRKNTRINKDPRNTNWINNEKGIGFKLLSSQGWQPGQGLGSELTGRTVNIKTQYKDDTAGIGCSPVHAQEWAGLYAFDALFSKLNSADVSGAATPDEPVSGKEERVFFMSTNAPRVGLDVRFVKGETFTSDLSKAKFYESLGLKPPNAVASDTIGAPPDAKAMKAAAKAAKAKRKAEREAKREAKRTVAAEDGKKEKKKSKKDKKDKKEKAKTASSSEPVRADVQEPSALPSRFAHRAKFQRAKMGGRLNAAQLAEVLGVKAS